MLDHAHATVRSVTKTVRIACHPQAAFEFLADLGNWPRWAVVNVKSTSRTDDPDWWDMVTLHGAALLRMRADARHGILDHDFVDSRRPPHSECPLPGPADGPGNDGPGSNRAVADHRAPAIAYCASRRSSLCVATATPSSGAGRPPSSRPSRSKARRRAPRCCARSSCCARPTARTRPSRGNPPRPGSFASAGHSPCCPAAPSTIAITNFACCPSCAAACAPATSGWRAAPGVAASDQSAARSGRGCPRCRRS